jgi:hypothetical protein
MTPILEEMKLLWQVALIKDCSSSVSPSSFAFPHQGGRDFLGGGQAFNTSQMPISTRYSGKR